MHQTPAAFSAQQHVNEALINAGLTQLGINKSQQSRVVPPDQIKQAPLPQILNQKPPVIKQLRNTVVTPHDMKDKNQRYPPAQ